jgi:hypothetical protein
MKSVSLVLSQQFLQISEEEGFLKADFPATAGRGFSRLERGYLEISFHFPERNLRKQAESAPLTQRITRKGG